MSSSAPPPSPGRDAAATLLAWGRRLWRRSQSTAPRPTQRTDSDPLLESGQCLRTAREARGLTLRQLALETRISTAVLEALEKGWRDRLPEATYLRTMLSLLEQHLELGEGRLEAALPPRSTAASAAAQANRLRRFPITSIEVFGTWQGAVLYGTLCLLLIYGLNRQQQQLAARGLLSLRPIPALPPSPGQESRAASSRASAGVLAAHPDLRPLERARRGQALQQLRRELQQRADANPKSGQAGSTKPGATPSGEAKTDEAKTDDANGASPASSAGAPAPNPATPSSPGASGDAN